MIEFDGRAVVLSLRIAQAVLALIILAVTAYVSNWWNSYWHRTSTSQVNFVIFDAVWTFLALAYLIIVPWRFSETRAHHKYAILFVEGVTMLFWFAGFVALAVWLSRRTCFGSVCSAAKASAVFGAFEWVLFTATTTMAVMHVMRTRDRTLYNDKADPNIQEYGAGGSSTELPEEGTTRHLNRAQHDDRRHEQACDKHLGKHGDLSSSLLL